MATRSTIAIEASDGTVKQVYCHWDGYLDHNGKILLAHYAAREKTEQLISLGSISSLRNNVGEQHNFDQTDEPREKQWTTAYHRDRGEDLNVYTYSNFEDYKANHQYEEYEYILRNDGNWYVSAYSEDYQLLADAIAEEMRQREMEEED